MKEFGDVLGLIPIEFVVSVTDIGTTLKPGYKIDLFFTENSVTPTETPAEKDQGISYSQSLKVTTDRLSAEERKRYERNRRCIVYLYHTDGNFTVWGTLDVPVSVSVLPHISADQISLNRKALNPIL